jgi:Site-specific recombinase XerD
MATFERRAGNWRAKVRRRGYPTQTATFDSRAEAEAWARDVEGEMDRGVFKPRREAERTTLYEALTRYEKEYIPQLKSWRSARSMIKLWQADPLAQRPLASIGSVDLAKWKRDQEKAGAAASTIRNKLNLLSGVFRVAAREWGMGGLDNPRRNVSNPPMPKGRDRRLTRDEERTIFFRLYAEAPDFARLVRLALESAMRMGEIAGLKWSDVNLKSRIVRLRDTKNGEERAVPLSKSAVAVLKVHRPEGAKPKDRVFQYQHDSISQKWSRLMEDLEIEDLRFHDLRHEAVSRLFERGLDPMQVASISGHKTMQMLKRYTHHRMAHLLEALDRPTPKLKKKQSL